MKKTSVHTKTENSDAENYAFRKRSLRWMNVKTLGLRCSVDRRRLSETMTFDCHDTAMTLPQACARDRDADQKMPCVMQMMISLYNVLIYLQIQLDIFAQTYSLLQRRRRALYLMFLSDGKKPESLFKL